MQIMYQYLRHEIPLVGQIISVFNRAYGLQSQAINEDESIQYRYKYLKPLKGGNKVWGFAPIVRFPLKVVHKHDEKEDIYTRHNNIAKKKLADLQTQKENNKAKELKELKEMRELKEVKNNQQTISLTANQNLKRVEKKPVVPENKVQLEKIYNTNAGVQQQS